MAGYGGGSDLHIHRSFREPGVAQLKSSSLLKESFVKFACRPLPAALCLCTHSVIPGVTRVFKIQWRIATSWSFDRSVTETREHASVINLVPHLDPTNSGAVFLREMQSNQNGGVWSVKCHGAVFLSAGVDGITTVQVMRTTQVSIFLFYSQLRAQHPFYTQLSLINI